MTSLTPFETLEERSPSAILANLLYLMFLVMGVILLVNMMIALLSNTYQKVQVKVSITLTAFPLVYCKSFKVQDFACLRPNISIHILNIVLHTFPMVVTRIFCVTIKSFLNW